MSGMHVALSGGITETKGTHADRSVSNDLRGRLNMFGFLKRKRKNLIGLDIGSNVVKCVRLDANTDPPRITHFAMVDLPPACRPRQ